MTWFLIIVAVLVGAALPLQALINARLATLTAGPLFAAAVSMGISFLLGAALVAWRVGSGGLSLPASDDLLRVPYWTWFGGLVGAVYVVAGTMGVPVLGASGFISLIVLGQMVGSLVLDHYGVLHASRAADPIRILGIGLVIIGTLLVLQPWKH